MASVKVLIEGYTSGETNGHTCSTVSLVTDVDKNGNKINIVTDPGSLPNKDTLITALKKEKLSVDDINFVFLTHQHLDHFMYLGLFENAKILFNDGIMKGDFWEPMPKGGIITKDIKIIKTPGHSDDSMTLLVNASVNGKNSVIAVCGDVFWRENFPKALKDDQYANNPKKLEQSRRMLLEIADYIIPGHDKMFKVEK